MVVQVLCTSAVAAGEPTLVIGQYLDQLDAIGARLNALVLTGKIAVAECQRLFAGFRSGELPVLVVSKAADFSVDLLEVSVAISVSGAYGSRQEEAQRLGRVLRPEHDGRQAWFFTVVARDTNDQEFALRCQLFLAEQGYACTIVDAEQIFGQTLKVRRRDGHSSSSRSHASARRSGREIGRAVTTPARGADAHGIA